MEFRKFAWLQDNSSVSSCPTGCKMSNFWQKFSDLLFEFCYTGDKVFEPRKVWLLCRSCFEYIFKKIVINLSKEHAVMNSFSNLVFFIFQVGQRHIEVLRQKSKSHRHAPDQMFEIKITGSLWWKIVRNHARQFWACWPAFCDSNRGQLPSFYTLPTHPLWRITVYLSFQYIFYLVI